MYKKRFFFYSSKNNFQIAKKYYSFNDKEISMKR